MIKWSYYDQNFGERLKLFYLPVIPNIRENSHRCYIFPLAPFVLIGYITYHVFMCVWGDLLYFSGLQIRLMKSKEKRR